MKYQYMSTIIWFNTKFRKIGMGTIVGMGLIPIGMGTIVGMGLIPIGGWVRKESAHVMEATCATCMSASSVQRQRT